IGQRYLEEEGLKIDEDSILIEEVCGIKSGLKDMNPIAVEKGFTEKYIAKPDKKAISSQILNSFRRVAKGQELVVIEGTGHAGVGSVFDHSNAAVARLLGSKVIIISSGGVGRPIDEIMLNKALFEKEGVKVIGVIVNKILPNKFDRISRLVRKGLEEKGVNVLGVLPYEPMLARPSIGQILDETGYRVLCGEKYLERSVAKVIVAAMEPPDAAGYISEDSLMITPGDRGEMIKIALDCFGDSAKKKLKICGIILTCGITPEPPVMDLLEKADIPVLLSDSDTYDVATSVHDITVKLRACDKEKIDAAVRLIKENVDFKKILNNL
ncbi:MAG: AAA family ATPase, partial [Candidatus Omnitrophica bacterium]|nr:AAA family ATPase [Candidatus Omnitrophota bacterium]